MEQNIKLYDIPQYSEQTIEKIISKINEELWEVNNELNKPTIDREALSSEVADLLQVVFTLSRKLHLCPVKMSLGLFEKFRERGLL